MKQTNGILDNTEAAAKKSVQSKLQKSDAEFKWRGLTKVLCRVKEALTWLIIPKTTAYSSGSQTFWDRVPPDVFLMLECTRLVSEERSLLKCT